MSDKKPVWVIMPIADTRKFAAELQRNKVTHGPFHTYGTKYKFQLFTYGKYNTPGLTKFLLEYAEYIKIA